MNKADTTQKNIEEFIKKGQIAEALEAFGEFLAYCAEARKDWIQIQGWYSGVYKEKILGVAGKEADIEINKITRSLIEKITDFEREILPNYFERKDFAYHINDLSNLDAFNIKALNALLSGRSYRIVNPDNNGSEIEKIGEGNSTISYMAYDENIKEYAIVQVFKTESAAEISSKWIDALVNLKHRNIVRTYDHSLNSYPRFIIKEYIHGITFEQAIKKTGKRPVSQAAWWLYQLADVLLYLQQKRVAHYNIRPSKIFIDDEWKIVLSPFDLSLLEESDRRISLNRFLSICKYISPEGLKSLSADSFFQPIKTGIFSAKNAEKWNDSAGMQFSLGAIIYFAITGLELFSGDSVYGVLKERDKFDTDPDYRKQKLTLMKKNAGSSDDEGKNKFLSIVERLLSADPCDRFSSLYDLLHDIHPLLQNHVYQGNDLQDSYRRALTNNSELIRDFYNALMEKSDISRKMFGVEDQDNMIKIRRQQAILQMTIDILVKDDDDERANEIRSKILNSPLHAGLSRETYGVFLDTLISSILASDPEYPDNPDLLQSWNSVKTQFLSLIEYDNQSDKNTDPREH